MSTRKLTRKEKIALQQSTAGDAPKKPRKEQEQQARSFRRLLGLAVAVLAFLVYTNTLHHGYVLDDYGLIPDNSLTKQGVAGLGEIFSTTYRTGMNIPDYSLYRPLSKAMFAVEWQLAPNNPALGHWVNVILFALTCLLIFHVLQSYLRGQVLLPFLTALLFAAHPIHTEVVANIKSRDEILALIFGLLTALFVFYYIKSGKKRNLLFMAATMFLGLLSKESTITWLAVIPLFMHFMSSAKKQHYIAVLPVLLFSTLIFMGIRNKILPDVDSSIPLQDNHLVAIKDLLLQRANAIYLTGVYIKQLLWPVTLMADGSYNHFEVVSFTSLEFIVPMLFLLGLGIFAILRFRRRDLLAFCILYFFVTYSIVSNIFFLIGTNYGERLLYMPSLGFCLAIALLIRRLTIAGEQPHLVNNWKEFMAQAKRPVLATSILFILMGVKSMARNEDWKDNLTLYTTDLEKAPKSVHLRFYLANHITSEESLAALKDSASVAKTRYEAIDHLTTCVEIDPTYADAFQRRAYIYFTLKDYETAEKDYKRSMELNPSSPVTLNNYGSLLFETQRFNEAKDLFEKAVRYNPLYAHANGNLASVYGVFGEGYYQQAREQSDKQDYFMKEGRKQFETAIAYFRKAVTIDPEYTGAWRMMGVTYQNLGDAASAEMCMRKVDELQKKR